MRFGAKPHDIEALAKLFREADDKEGLELLKAFEIPVQTVKTRESLSRKEVLSKSSGNRTVKGIDSSNQNEHLPRFLREDYYYTESDPYAINQRNPF